MFVTHDLGDSVGGEVLARDEAVDARPQRGGERHAVERDCGRRGRVQAPDRAQSRGNVKRRPCQERIAPSRVISSTIGPSAIFAPCV